MSCAQRGADFRQSVERRGDVEVALDDVDDVQQERQRRRKAEDDDKQL